MTSAMIELWQLEKTYPAPGGGEAVVVRDFDLKIERGEFVCVIGHSGCGKSTVLSIVMGLVPPTSGAVIVAGKEVTGPGCDRGVVFQSAALLPWLSVRDNVLLSIDQVKGSLSRAERVRLADRYLTQVGLDGAGDLRPDDLSSGMRQRVGIARAFALESPVLLLDEPFSLLDAMTRLELQDQLLGLWESSGKTVLMVTHDVDEAIFLADRIVMMTSGPAARIGGIVDVALPRPRSRHGALESREYFETRDRLLGFLENGAAENH